MQLEIDHLKKKLCHARRKQTPSNSDVSSDDEEDISYKRRSRTPPSESFSYNEEHHHERRYKSPPRKGLGNDTMSRALNQISKSPFTRKIGGARLPQHFNQPTFIIYNGQMDLVKHVSHFNQRMAVHSKNEALMCKVFPSSLGPVTMRWFDGLGVGSIDSFNVFTRAFGSRFISCSRILRPLDSLLSLTMKERETLKMYSDKHWEIFNEIDGDFDDVAIRTFKVRLPAEHVLWKSLVGKPTTSVRQLMDRIDKYKRVEEDQYQGKGKAKVISQEMRDFRSDRYNNNQP
ncbi:uncharacterized protein LOC115984911 [Quercus lobata]|uniref:uncharacterized protein LOC115984911 n=1 Tax=Quercus lobata TaxID=97700 RepID=UPI0012494021|nr:uncharacterized protein LOC115984911 [Quercus lobata]